MGDFWIMCIFIVLFLLLFIVLCRIVAFTHRITKQCYWWRTYYEMLNKWMIIRENFGGQRIGEYLHTYNMDNIAIYGMGVMGRHLLYDLKNDKYVKVAYIIDQSIEHIDMEDKYTPNDMLPSVDAIIVTPLFKFEEIATGLREKVDCPIFL